MRFRRDVQDAGAVARAAHARVRNAQHVAHALLQSFFGIGSMPHSGMPGPPIGPALRSTMTWSGVTSRSRIVHRLRHLVIGVEHDRRAGMLQQARLGGRRLDHAAVRREVAVEDRGAAGGRDRIVERADDVVVVDLGAADAFAASSARTPSARRDAASIRAGRAARGCRRRCGNPPSATCPEGRRLTITGTVCGEIVEILSASIFDAGAAGHRDQMDHRVGRAGQRVVHDKRVLERARDRRCRRA